jgi:hypothetical protein
MELIDSLSVEYTPPGREVAVPLQAAELPGQVEKPLSKYPH